MASSKGGLRFGGRSVDLVREDDVGEEGTLHEFELPRLVEDFRADDVAGHQVRGELDAVEAEAQRLGNRVHQKCFCQAGNAHKQDVPASKNGGGDFANDLILADDDFADFGNEGLVLRAERVKRGFVVGKVCHVKRAWGCA